MQVEYFHIKGSDIMANIIRAKKKFEDKTVDSVLFSYGDGKINVIILPESDPENVCDLLRNKVESHNRRVNAQNVYFVQQNAIIHEKRRIINSWTFRDIFYFG